MSLVIERRAHLKQFVDQFFPKASESLESMVGDAGQRNYYRVWFKGKTYVVMDCPPEYCSMQPFVDIATYLQNKKFSAPRIIEQDIQQGFLILEDFGSLSMKDYLLDVVTYDSARYKDIYYLIVDLLIKLQKEEAPSNLPVYSNELLLSELELFADWYIPYTCKRKLYKHELVKFQQIWTDILDKQISMQNSIVLRDYHVENIMYLKQNKSIQKLGLLDFQDALIGSPVYDLVSILEDARIDVARSDALQYIEYFSQKKNIDMESVLLNYHILGAQRNSRILGVFARKLLKGNDNSYLQYIPRVVKYLEYDLSHLIFAPLKNWLKNLEL